MNFIRLLLCALCLSQSNHCFWMRSGPGFPACRDETLFLHSCHFPSLGALRGSRNSKMEGNFPVVGLNHKWHRRHSGWASHCRSQRNGALPLIVHC
jgi:hypothetical protein